MTSTPSPQCPCGGQTFRANVRIPTYLHFSPEEETLEVWSVEPAEITYQSLTCSECGTSAGGPGATAAHRRAFQSVQQAMESALGDARVMTPLEP